MLSLLPLTLACSITPTPQPPQTPQTPPAFQGPQSGIGSWFRSNNPADSTNGHSWCGYPYTDDTPGFAPDILQMTDNNQISYEEAAGNYCGLEATVTNPDNGETMTLYIIDAFDHQWVLSPGSIDIMTNTFNQLVCQTVTDKNTVIHNVQWQLTGNKNDKYKFYGVGDA